MTLTALDLWVFEAPKIDPNKARDFMKGFGQSNNTFGDPDNDPIVKAFKSFFGMKKKKPKKKDSE